MSSSYPTDVLFCTPCGQSGLLANGHNPVRDDDNSLHPTLQVGNNDYTSIPLHFHGIVLEDTQNDFGLTQKHQCINSNHTVILMILYHLGCHPS
jgi:hypothetical protein